MGGVHGGGGIIITYLHCVIVVLVEAFRFWMNLFGVVLTVPGVGGYGCGVYWRCERGSFLFVVS